MYKLVPQTQGSTIILRLTGSVSLKETVQFNDELREFSKKPNLNQLVLDLGSVEKMDQAGLGALVSLNTSMQRYGRRLVLLNPAAHIEELMKTAEIEGFFAVCESEEELKGFIPEGQRKAR